MVRIEKETHSVQNEKRNMISMKAAGKILGVSKWDIKNRIFNGTIDYTVKNGVYMVDVNSKHYNMNIEDMVSIPEVTGILEIEECEIMTWFNNDELYYKVDKGLYYFDFAELVDKVEEKNCFFPSKFIEYMKEVISIFYQASLISANPYFISKVQLCESILSEGKMDSLIYELFRKFVTFQLKVQNERILNGIYNKTTIKEKELFSYLSDWCDNNVPIDRLNITFI